MEAIAVEANELQEQFKQILEYGINRGNESTITVQQLVQELTEKLKEIFDNQLECK